MSHRKDPEITQDSWSCTFEHQKSLPACSQSLQQTQCTSQPLCGCLVQLVLFRSDVLVIIWLPRQSWGHSPDITRSQSLEARRVKDKSAMTRKKQQDLSNTRLETYQIMQRRAQDYSKADAPPRPRNLFSQPRPDLQANSRVYPE